MKEESRYVTVDEIRAVGREFLSHFSPEEQTELKADMNNPKWRKMYAARRSMAEYVASRNFVFKHSQGGPDYEVTERKPHLTWVEEKAIWRTPGNPDTEMHSAYALDGSYIGEVSDGKFFEKEGIVPERSEPDNNVASIGFQPSTGKWWGWSHRGRSSFLDRSKAAKFAESVAMYREFARLLRG